MRTIATNKELYQDKEFHDWATREDLVDDEIFIIRNYLDPKAKTIESGVGGGRITIALKKMGFTSLNGFDFVPEFVEAAKAKDPEHSINLEVQDATSLTYPDNSFEQLLYLAQMLSAIDTPQDQQRAIKECYRIAKPGALVILSFLSWDTRLSRPLHAFYTRYLTTFRAAKGSNRPIQSQPWLKHGGRMNLSALTDSPPYLYYFQLHEISEHIRLSGLQLIEVGSTYQISRRLPMCKDFIELGKQPIRGAIFAMCRKPTG